MLFKKREKYFYNEIIWPIKENFLHSKEILINFENGDICRYYTYSLFPFDNIDGKPLFNGYGQKIYNDNYLNK